MARWLVMRIGRMAVLALAVSLSACALPEARVRSGLVSAGLSEPLAACMAQRMVDRLSLAQLRRLGRLSAAGQVRGVGQFLARARALGDPEIVAVTTSSAALCATGLAG